MPHPDLILGVHRELSTRLLTQMDRTPKANSAGGSIAHAVGIGRKIVGGRRTELPSVQVYVTQKLPEERIAEEARIPREVGGVPTDVVQSPMAMAAAGGAAAAVPCTDAKRTRVRPVIAGISAGHGDTASGTLGAFCRSLRREGKIAEFFVLSNNHVFANLDSARAGDALLQPGKSDDSDPKNAFAEFARAAPIVRGPAAQNLVDAAIGRLLPGIAISNQICSIGRISGWREAQEQMSVRKHGRTTGLTHGVVTNERIDALIGLNAADPTEVTRFVNQIRIEPTPESVFIAGPGDSGALVVTGEPAEAVGLLFAAPPDGSYGYANQIADVLSELEIELLIG